EIAAKENLVFVHPFDDPKVIAGQGTVALEMLADAPDLDLLIVPVGGGGLIAGIALAARATRPKIEIIGVESTLYPSLWNKLHDEARVCGGPTLADGIAVKETGKLTLPIIRELVKDVLLVEEAHLERAVNAFLTLQMTLAEGAGAAGLAAVLADPARFHGKRIGLVVTGGNIDPRVAASIMVRELERAERIVSFRITIQDRPGTLGEIATLLGRLGANILEVDHRRLFLDVPAKGARLDVTIETRDKAHAEDVERKLRAEGLAVVRLDTGTGGYEPV
ncbi:MAG TPA: pyridoxal-phosphate dependent enzyme, partial [Xanthobacteraceae bacterium]